MKQTCYFRAVVVAAMLTGWMLASRPATADAAWVKPDDAVGLESRRPQPAGERVMPADQGPSVSLSVATLSVNFAIMALGSLWLVLMARRVQLRGAGDGMGEQMLSGGAPRHVAGGR